MATTELDELMANPEVGPLLKQQFVDAALASMKGMSNAELREKIIPEDAELAEAIAGGGEMNLVASMESKPLGMMTIYATIDGEPRDVLIYNVGKLLARTHKEGSLKGKPVFTVSPRMPFVTGKVKCWLHPEHPRREFLDKIGLTGRICMSANLASEFDARIHCKNRHSQSYQVIQEAEQRAKEDREADRWAALLAATQGQAPVVLPAKPKVVSELQDRHDYVQHVPAQPAVRDTIKPPTEAPPDDPVEATQQPIAPLRHTLTATQSLMTTIPPAGPVTCRECGWTGKNDAALRLHVRRWCNGARPSP